MTREQLNICPVCLLNPFTENKRTAFFHSLKAWVHEPCAIRLFDSMYPGETMHKIDPTCFRPTTVIPLDGQHHQNLWNELLLWKEIAKD